MWYSRYRVHNRLRTVLRTAQGCLNYNRIYISSFILEMLLNMGHLFLFFNSTKYTLHFWAFGNKPPKKFFASLCHIFPFLFLACIFLPKMWKKHIFDQCLESTAPKTLLNSTQMFVKIYKKYTKFIVNSLGQVALFKNLYLIKRKGNSSSRRLLHLLGLSDEWNDPRSNKT